MEGVAAFAGSVSKTITWSYSRSNRRKGVVAASTMAARCFRFLTGVPLKRSTCVLTMSSYPMLMSATRTWRQETEEGNVSLPLSRAAANRLEERSAAH